MHVLMLSLDTTLFNPDIGNSRDRHIAYAKALSGQISMVVLNRGNGPAREFKAGGFAARSTESRSYFAYLRDGYSTAMQMYRERPFDVITAQDPFLTALVGIMLRRSTRAPLIIQNHSSFLTSPHFVQEKRRNHLLRLMARLTLPRADAIRTVNRRERLACIRARIDADRVCVIPVATDINAFLAPPDKTRIAEWRQKLDLEPGAPVILWVGRPVTFKNIPMLLTSFQRVLKEIPEARLVLAGDMRDTNFIGQTAARGIDHAVRFPGPVPYQDLPPLYHMATVYALSSNYEGLMRVLLEACAAGLPVVSTDNAGAADLILDGITGVLSPIGDDARFAKALVSLLRDPERQKRLAEKARDHVITQYDPEMLSARWTRMIAQVARRQPPCAS